MPSMAVSHIMLEAYKKHVLVSLILHGKVCIIVVFVMILEICISNVQVLHTLSCIFVAVVSIIFFSATGVPYCQVKLI